MHSRRTSFGYRISKLHRLVARFIRERVSAMNIEQGQVPFLAELFHEEGVPQEVLASRLFIDKGVTARQLARMEQNGLIVRRVNAENKRQKLVFLADDIRARREEFFSHLNALTEALGAGFSDAERPMALEFLDRMTENMLACTTSIDGD
ncbi:MAG: MarR family winged helix-turn-helix transcriptional regulator [Halodesulfovibrio sp.]